MANAVRAALAEFIGTGMLVTAVVGSGIMGAKLAAGNDAIALLANSIATGGALVALIAALQPISGAQFNPAVTGFEFIRGHMTWRVALLFVAAQLSGAIGGVVVAHAMFELPLVQEAMRARATVGEQIGEAVATFGLLLTIWGVGRSRAEAMPYAVAAYIVGAYWFTSSTSFANPAVTIARSFTDTFAGIAHDSILGFLVAQAIGVLLAATAARILSTPAISPSESEQPPV